MAGKDSHNTTLIHIKKHTQNKVGLAILSSRLPLYPLPLYSLPLLSSPSPHIRFLFKFPAQPKQSELGRTVVEGVPFPAHHVQYVVPGCGRAREGRAERAERAERGEKRPGKRVLCQIFQMGASTNRTQPQPLDPIHFDKRGRAAIQTRGLGQGEVRSRKTTRKERRRHKYAVCRAYVWSGSWNTQSRIV